MFASEHSVKNLLNVETLRKSYGRLIHGDIFNGDEELGAIYKKYFKPGM
jgi:hypothetical protein